MSDKRLIRIATPPGQIGTFANLQVTVDGKPLDGVCEIAIGPLHSMSIVQATITAYVELDLSVPEGRRITKPFGEVAGDVISRQSDEIGRLHAELRRLLREGPAAVGV
jgi:hypothetical protein